MQLGSGQLRPVVFGEVLFDVFPDGTRVLGGAPFNVAWHLHALGLDPLMITRVGTDDDGDAVLTQMQSWGMTTEGVQRDADHPTGQVQVQLEHGEPHYRIVQGAAWDAIAIDALPALPDRSLLYHGTLATRSEQSRAALLHLKRQLKSTTFVDVNLRDPWWQRAEVREAVATATCVKLNEDELHQLTTDGDPRELLAFPGLAGVVLTRGERGATWLTAEGSHQVRPTLVPSDGDPVGAGDAFAAVCIAGLIQEWPAQTTLERATVLASRIVALRGATTSDPSLYQGLGD